MERLPQFCAISVTYLSRFRHEQDCALPALLLDKWQTMHCNSHARFTTDHQQVAAHNEAAAPCILLRKIFTSAFHFILLTSMCKSVANQKANRATCDRRHSLRTLVGMLRSCAHCVHSARLERRIQNTQAMVRHSKENWLQNAYASKRCFTGPNSGCSWWSRISGIKDNVPSDYYCSFRILRNKPVHKARWGGLTVSSGGYMQTCRTACSWHSLQSYLKGALQPTTILTCFATLFLFGNGTKNDNTKKSAHIWVIAIHLPVKWTRAHLLTVHEYASHKQAFQGLSQLYKVSTCFAAASARTPREQCPQKQTKNSPTWQMAPREFTALQKNMLWLWTQN